MIEQAAEVVASVAADMAAAEPVADLQPVLDQLMVLHQDFMLVIVCLALLIGLMCSFLIVRHWRL